MLALWLAMLFPCLAATWPLDEAWLPLERAGVPMVDGVDLDGSLDYVDLYGTETVPVGRWSADSTHVFFRIVLVEDPLDVDALELGTWGVLLETDGIATDFEDLIAVSGPDGATELYRNATNAVGTEPILSAYSKIATYGDLDSEDVRVIKGDSNEYNVDFAVERADLGTDASIFDASGLRVAVVTGAGPTAARLDVAECDDGSDPCTDLEAVLSDAIVIDGDEDGWTDPEEALWGTDPLDADSDDDGLLDGNESTEDVDGDGLIGAFDCDSDNDGLFDGTEAAGGQAANPDTSVDAGCYVADLNANTATDPNNPDTDGGGMDDGDEDWNHDGAVDAWETDPTDGTDDADTDGDGIADDLEEGFDADGDGDDNDQDLDSDEDGINDSAEWPGDSDGDGTPDFLDDDSDGDGIPDAVEGGEDSDGDDLPDYLDPDSDNDDTPDVDEGTGDDDCDGIPNYLDPDDSDGCDTDLPAVDTGEFTWDSDTGEVRWSGGHFTGGACTSVPATTSVLLALAALAFVRRSRGIAALMLLIGTTASAQDVNAQRFSPTVDGVSFVKLEEAALPPSGSFGGGLWFNHANDPFIFRYSDGSEMPILGAVGTFDAASFYSLGVVRFGARIPIHAYRNGFSEERVVGRLPAALGDIGFSVKGQLFETASTSLAVWLGSTLPTSPHESWVGAGHLGAAGGLALSWRSGKTTALANAGLRRGSGEVFGTLMVTPAMEWGIGLSQAFGGHFGASAEVDGDLWLKNADEPGAAPVEWLLSGHANPFGAFRVAIGAGGGLSRGVGAPDFRLVSGVSWVPAKAVAERVLADADADGVVDASDLCPGQAEDKNGVQDGDGCPDDEGRIPTTLEVVTTDGILIAGARIDLRAGPESGAYVASDGRVRRALIPGQYEIAASAERYSEVVVTAQVPANVPMHAVRIALAPPNDLGHLVIRAVGPSGVPVSGAEVRIVGTLGIPLKTGHDGIFEADLIPGGYEISIAAPGWTGARRTANLTSAGTFDMTVFMEPTAVVIDTEHKQIFLHRKIFFELDKADLKVESLAVLDDLVETLKEHPEILRLRIEGHTDAQGTEAYNLELSKARAQAVVDYLVRQGIDGTRLVAEGFGENRPLQQGDTESVYATNRRVEFHILEMEEKP